MASYSTFLTGAVTPLIFSTIRSTLSFPTTLIYCGVIGALRLTKCPSPLCLMISKSIFRMNLIVKNDTRSANSFCLIVLTISSEMDIYSKYLLSPKQRKL